MWEGGVGRRIYVVGVVDMDVVVIGVLGHSGGGGNRRTTMKGERKSEG